MASIRVRVTSVSVIAFASSAASAQAPVELPPIVVTTPSPVQSRPAITQQQAARQIAVTRVRNRRQRATVASASATPTLPALGPTGGVSLSIPTDPSFVAVTVATQDEITRSPAQNIGQALQNKPGITTTGFAAGSDRPVIRGLSGFRVSTQENGIGTGDVAGLSDDHAVTVDPYSARQIEVVRGPATLRYGSQAIGGVVNATNSRIPDAIPVNGVMFETRGGVSSVDRGRNASFVTEAGADNFVVHADAFERRSEDYNTPRGRQLNSDVKSYGSSLGSSFVGRDGFIGVSFTTFNSTYSIPGGEQEASRNFLDVVQQKFQGRAEYRVGEYGVEAIRTWFGYSNYKHREIDRLVDADDGMGGTIKVPGFSVGSIFKQEQYEGRVEVQHKPFFIAGTEVRGALGAQYTDRKLLGLSDPEGEKVPLIPENKTRNTAGYIFEEFQLTKPLRFQAAGRVENSDVKGTGTTFPADFLPTGDPDLGIASIGTSKQFVPKSASAGFLYQFPSNIVARITAQHVERAPDATELFYRGPHDSTATFEIGDPNLKIERANTFEIGLKRAIGQLRFDASAYHTNFQNFIYKRDTGVRCPDTFDTCVAPGNPNAARQIVYSQRNAEFTGAELQGEYDVAALWRGMWGLSGQFDFVRARFEDGSNVPKIPPYRLGAGIYYYDRSFLARLTYLHAFEQDDFAAFDTRTKGYDLVNAEVSYTTKLDKRDWLTPELTIGLRGENLLNDDIRNAVSFKKDQILEPGRNIRVFGSFKLN